MMGPGEAQAFLESLPQLGMRFGLDRMRRALQALGHPERSSFKVLHVAGTNGKGSTCAFAAAILERAGLKVGLYTSPHLVRMNERIRVNGRAISDEATAELVDAVLAAFPQARGGEDPLTFFELDTLLALLHFHRERVEVAVLETGLGGRLDATNAVESEVAAISHLALDHTRLLGDTVAAVAAEKAGILKAGARAVFARQAPEALAVLEEAARRVGGSADPPLVAGRDFAIAGGEEEEGQPLRFQMRDPPVEIGELRLGLLGAHQRENAETAVAAAVLLLASSLAPGAVRQGLAGVRWPGRMEIVDRSPLTILDGAHNPDAAGALAAAVRQLFPARRVHLVFGMLADKDVVSVCRHLLPLAARAYLASPASERALPVGSLAATVAGLGLGVAAGSYASIAQALAAARAAARAEGPESLVLLAGSLYAVGEAQACLSKSLD